MIKNVQERGLSCRYPMPCFAVAPLSMAIKGCTQEMEIAVLELRIYTRYRPNTLRKAARSLEPQVEVINDDKLL